MDNLFTGADDGNWNWVQIYFPVFTGVDVLKNSAMNEAQETVGSTRKDSQNKV
jgi:hypothetical protein